MVATANASTVETITTMFKKLGQKGAANVLNLSV